MNIRTLFMLLGFSLFFGSCATAYKTGQTPDDVYNSPAPPQDEYANVKKADEKRYRDYEGYDEEEDYADYDDRYLRMKVRNRYRWSELDDWYYYGNRYNFSYYNNWYYWNDPFYWNTPWSPVSYWNMYYNPYYAGWGGGLGLGFGWEWGGGWYNPWYAGYYGGWGWGGGWYDPWYTGWWGNPYYYGYGPGVIVGSRVNYNQRRTNLNTYNPNVLNRGNTTTRGTTSRGSGASYGAPRDTRNAIITRRSTGNYGTYGVRSDRSVNTNTTNSSSQGRANALRDRYATPSRGTYSNPRYNSNNAGRYSQPSRVETYSRPSSDSRSSAPSYSPPSGGGGGRSSGGASGRRF